MRKLLMIVAGYTILILLSCSKKDIRHTVQYYISSKGNMNVGYIDRNGEMIYITNVSSDWKYSFNGPGEGRIISLSVKSVDGNTVAGLILIDGQDAAVSSSNTSSITIATRLP